jgi:serine protease inhibitor
MNKKRVLGGLLTLLLLLTGCGGPAFQTPLMPKPDDSILNSFQASMAARNNDFGFQIYKELYDGDDNIMISPVSIAMALAMTYNGAEGETKEAMAKALQIQGIEMEKLNRNNLALLYFLKTADPQVTLNIANSIWMRQGFAFAPDFLSRVQDFYRAAAQELDFTDPKAADTMNNWVKENTQGLIEEIVEPPIDPLTVMFLINAVYFKGEWSEKFDKDMTSDQPFHLAPRESVMVPMMSQSGGYDYLSTPGFEALRLPYGKEKRMAMYLFLPDENSNLETFQKELSGENWANWLPLFAEKQGSILLPRFTLEYEETLNQALKALGMGIAFDPAGADFTAMVPEEGRDDLYISEVKHKTFIQVDEVGTEAAAVTSVEMRVTSAPMYDFYLEFNRPFFYAIHDSETGAILFMGAVLNPQGN